MSTASSGFTYLGPVFNTLYGLDNRQLPSDYHLLFAYAVNDIVYACANYNANAVAQVPLKLYAKKGRDQKGITSHATRGVDRAEFRRLRKGGSSRICKMLQDADVVEEITDHPLLDLLASNQENDNIGGFKFVQLTQLYLEIVGRAYWKINRDGLGDGVSAFDILPPQRCLPVRVGGGAVTGFRNQPVLMGVWETLETEEVVDFTNVSLDDPWGWGHSPLKACYRKGILTGKFTQWISDILDNRARVDGIFTPDDDIGKEMAAKAEDSFKQRFGGAGKGGVWFSPTKGKFTPTNYSPTDLGPIEFDKNTVSAVCRAFGVPEPIIAANESTFANMEQALELHGKFTIRPRLMLLEQRLNDTVTPEYGDRLFLAFDNPVPEDQEFDLKRKTFAATNQGMTKNEIRDVAGLPPTDDPADDELAEPVDETAGEPAPTEPDKKPEPAAKDDEDVAKAFTDSVLRINKAVTNGEMTRSVAIVTLAKAFKIGEEEARGLVGAEKIVKAEAEAIEPPLVHKFASTQIMLPPELAQAIVDYAGRIPVDELAEDGIEKEPHITIKYGLHDDNPQAVRDLLTDEPPIDIRMGACSLFPATEEHPYDVLKIDIISDDLARLNAKICAAVPNTETHPEYKPHATIAYLKPGRGQEHMLLWMRDKTATIGNVVFSASTGERSTIPLNGVKPLPKANPAADLHKAITGTVPDDYPKLTEAMQGYFAEQKAAELAIVTADAAAKAKQRRENDEKLAAMLLLFMLGWATNEGVTLLPKFSAPSYAAETFHAAIGPAVTEQADEWAGKINAVTARRIDLAAERIANAPPVPQVGTPAATPPIESPEGTTPHAPPTPAEPVAEPPEIEPPPTLSTLIDEIFANAIDKRAETISEDMAYKAKVLGQTEAAKASTTVVRKVWIAQPGACPICDAMNGQSAEPDADFVTKEGERLYPGSVHAHCRCSQMLVMDDGTVVFGEQT